MVKTDDAPHPGKHIRAVVIPRGMSVTKAATLMCVSRPALSNLLNGNSALSPDMAARLEAAFNYPRAALLDLQAKYDAAQARKRSAPADTKTYVPPFLNVKANDIEAWASHSISARSRLAVLLRILVHSTGRALTTVDFPGNDDAERAGWDGIVDAGEGTPWVPAGVTGWEFGTNEDIKAKAAADYEKSVAAVPPKKRAAMTFVFVTPRRWPGKKSWADASSRKKHWRGVRAYDASDLEQWLEQSIAAQVWFANETGRPSSGVRSLDKCWTDWANVADPPLVAAFFTSAVESARQVVLPRLSAATQGPTMIAADSVEEGLAFLAQMLGTAGGEQLAAHRDRVLVFDEPGVVPRLAKGMPGFLPVAYKREVERELATMSADIPSFVLAPRNVTSATPHFSLEPVSYDTFESALKEMGKTRDEISRLAKESGRSLTVLRRRLASVPAVKSPQWATNHETATSLVPLMLVGAWQSENIADTIALSLLADRPYPEIERDCQRFLTLDDAPTWSIGTYRGVVSKLDLLYAISGAVSHDDLKRYFSLARLVLGEDDPALDLDVAQRWAAAIHGKRRELSSAFRRGISETLVLLAVYGGELFKARLGVDTEAEASQVVRDLLPSPLTTRILEANDRDLATYAEAAPHEFLLALERDLKSETPAVFGLLRPVDSGVMAHPTRTGLLWALETLSWNPRTLARTALILARLSAVEIDDNWMNKPANSLAAIFRAWMPQTAASVTDRVALVKTLADRFPDVAWRICMRQISGQPSIGHYSHKPRWRPDAFGFGEPVRTMGAVIEFQVEMLNIALGWTEHSLSTLGDLVERLGDLDGAHQEIVWTLIETWARDRATDSDKAALREKIRVSVLSRRAARRGEKERPAPLVRRAQSVSNALEPTDVLNRYIWLFREAWVEESADEAEETDVVDYNARGERLQRMRLEAMRELLELRGVPGVLALATAGKAAWTAGFIAAKDLLNADQLSEFLRLALRSWGNSADSLSEARSAIQGATRAALISDKLEETVRAAVTGGLETDLVRLLTVAPFCRTTWLIVDSLSASARESYWRDVAPPTVLETDIDEGEAVERLLRARRPRAAFCCLRTHPIKLDAGLLHRMLMEVAGGGEDAPGSYLLESYRIQEACEHLDRSPLLTIDEKALLEYAFIEALAPTRVGRDAGRGVPNLERYVETHPDLYVRAIVWLYQRSDGGQDPSDWQVPAERRPELAQRGYALLGALRRVPGGDDPANSDSRGLREWCGAVRRACACLGRADVGDVCIGELLANAPVGSDGVWPCESVRNVLEELQSEQVLSGAHTGVYNARGLHVRRPGGEQERELAEKYRRWGQALQVSHPFVSSGLLFALAETYEREGVRQDHATGVRLRLE